ncbi:MAG TPA: hypothetical protein PKE47_16305, partial [Verrucomicrobiota bacterium]|nr:hypothetical protein [Verrucomicrobiota bacterium]
AEELRALTAGPRLAGWLAAGGAEGDERRTRALESYFLVTRAPEWRAATASLAVLETERSAIRGRSPLTHVQVEKKDSKAVAHILFRGQYDQPREEVEAATPEALHPWPEGAPRNRLGLAKWILADENPLFARV